MTFEQIAGFVRTVLAFVGGYFVSQGYVDEATMMTIIGGAAAFIAAVWSYMAKKPA